MISSQRGTVHITGLLCAGLLPEGLIHDASPHSPPIAPRHIRRTGHRFSRIAALASKLQTCRRYDHLDTGEPHTCGVSGGQRAALLLSPVVRSINIGVESHQGVVLLSGMAADPTQLDLAVFVALNVPGVAKVDSFMFSTGIAPAAVTQSVYSGAPELLQQQRELDRAPHRLPPATDGALVAQPSTSEGAHTAQGAARPSPLRRWVLVTYGILGISSIHDELQIK